MECPTVTGSSVKRGGGFTLLELLVVMAIIGALLTIAAPRYFRSLEHSKEVILRQDVTTLRESIDRFYGDTGRYPESLAVLVEKHYLRAVPVDPITKSAETWVLIHAEEPEDTGVKDVHSGAEGEGEHGVAYALL
jgi:general secretion pathway protein G